jgi:hypothetical protein
LLENEIVGVLIKVAAVAVVVAVFINLANLATPVIQSTIDAFPVK